MTTKIKSSVKLILLLIIASNAAFAQTKQPATKLLITYHDYRKTMVHEKTNVLVSNPTVFHGSYKRYAQNTVVTQEGNYNNGNPVGIWHYRNESDGLEYKTENYNQNGELHGEVIGRAGKSKSIDHYKNGKLDGSQKAWNEAGILVTDLNYVSDLHHGRQTKSHYATGKLLSECFYDMGKKIGTWKFYYDDGVLRQEEIYDGDGNANTTLYEPDGAVIVPGQKKIYYNKQGSVCEKKDAYRYRVIENDTTPNSPYAKKGVGYYITGEKYWEARFPELNQNQIKFWDGEEKYYYKNGKIRSVGTYERSKRKSDWKYYDKNGDLDETYYDDEYGWKDNSYIE